MSNPAIADLIAARLATGLPHPGDPSANQPAISIPLAGFRTTGMSPEQAQSVNATAKLVAEALVNLIETEGDATIVPTSELAQLKTADETGGATPVTCQDCGQPVFYLTARGDRLSVSKAQRRALVRTEHRCEASA